MMNGRFRTECNDPECFYWQDHDTFDAADGDCNDHAKNKHGVRGWGLYCSATIGLGLSSRKPHGLVPLAEVPIPTLTLP